MKVQNKPSLKLYKTEWVCLIFLFFAGLRLSLSSVPFQWNATRWNTFPRMDILFIALTVWVLKLFRRHRISRLGIILLLILCCYGFTINMADPFIPFRDYLSSQSILVLIQWRFPLLAFIFFIIGFTTHQNNLVLKKEIANIRIILPFFFIVYLYPFIPLIINAQLASGEQDYDFLLTKIDSWLFFGHNPLLLIETWITPMLSEWMAFSYSAYGPLFALVFGCLYLKKDKAPIEEMIFMNTLALAIGYAGYSFIPARGPLFTQHFTVPLDLYYMKDFKNLYMDQPRIDRDCFPSLHTAITLLSLFSAWKFLRPLFWIILPIAICVPIACVYLRYHYVVDVLAGIALATLVISSNYILEKSTS